MNVSPHRKGPLVNDVYVKYTGPKAALNVQFPLPFVAKCEADGDPLTLRRGKPTKVTYEQSQQLLAHAPDVIERVEPEVRK
jgi:hypothetical protein